MTETIWSMLMKLNRLKLNNIRIIPPNLNEKFRDMDFIADFTTCSIYTPPETRHTSIRFALSLALCHYGLNEL